MEELVGKRCTRVFKVDDVFAFFEGTVASATLREAEIVFDDGERHSFEVPPALAFQMLDRWLCGLYVFGVKCGGSAPGLVLREGQLSESSFTPRSYLKFTSSVVFGGFCTARLGLRRTVRAAHSISGPTLTRILVTPGGAALLPAARGA